MTKHLARIETQTLTEKPSTSNLLQPPEKPFYKLINVPQKDLEAIKFTSDADKNLEEIKKKLENLHIRKSTINTMETDELEINKLRFQNKNYPKLRNYYSRPTYPDIQFEEKGELIQNSFTGSNIVEWNLDGLSEQGILDLTCQMTMAATAYKSKGISERNTTITLV